MSTTHAYAFVSVKVPKRWRTRRRSQNESEIPGKNPSLSPLEPVGRSTDLLKVKTSKRCANAVFTRSLGSGSYSSLGLVTTFLPTPCHCSSALVAASSNLVTSLVSSLGSGSYSSLGLVTTFVTTPCSCSSGLAAASPNLVTSLVSAVCLVTVLLAHLGRLALVATFRPLRVKILDDGART
jgi:hypothetical protein